MSQQLVIFIEKLTREVSEGGQTCRRVRLMSEGTVFETWEPVHGSGLEPEQWARDAETLVQALIPELPKRRVQLTFVAEDSSGATISTQLRTVTGQNASAQDLGTQNGAKALADAIASVGKTMDATLETARKIMEFQQQTIEQQATQLSEAHELFMAIRKAELESTDQDNVASRIIMEQVQSAAPLLMTLLENWATRQPAKAVAQVAAAATAASNGAKVS
jgi:hypothetical protein